MNDNPWNSQGVGQDCISGIDRLIFLHNVYRDNTLICLSQGCDFWYQASHCLKHFVELLVTLPAYFFQKMPELSWQPVFRTLTYQFFPSVQYEKGSLYLSLKCSPHMQRKATFFHIMQTLYMDTNWSNMWTPPIFACCSPQKFFGIGKSTRFLADLDHRWFVLTRLQVT